MWKDSIDGTWKNRTNSISNVKLRYIKKYLAAWPKVLDIACGYGRYSKLARDTFHKEVIGIDLDKRETIDFEFHVCDLEKWIQEFKDKEFDTVFAFDIIEHIHHEEELIQDIARVCKDTVIVSVPYKDDSLLRKHYLTTVARIDPTHVRYYDWPELAEKFAKLWFEILSVKREGQLSPGFIAEFFPKRMRKIVWIFFHGLYKLKILYNEKIAWDVFIVAKRKWS